MRASSVGHELAISGSMGPTSSSARASLLSNSGAVVMVGLHLCEDLPDTPNIGMIQATSQSRPLYHHVACATRALETHVVCRATLPLCLLLRNTFGEVTATIPIVLVIWSM